MLPTFGVSLPPFRPNRSFWLAALGLLALGAGLRFTLLGQAGLFVDEGGHILAPVDADVRAAIDPLGEGKPGMLWVFAPATALPGNPLVNARAITGLCGLVTAVALAVTLWQLAGAFAALMGLGGWVLLPFVVFHERFALLDPPLATLLALALALATLARRPRATPVQALLLDALAGLLGGAACLVKISALLAAPWLALCVCGIQRRYGRPLLDRGVAILAGGFVLPPLAVALGAATFARRLPLHADAAPGGAAGLFHFYFDFGDWPLALLLLVAIGLAAARPGRGAWWFAAAWIASLAVARLAYAAPYARYAHADHLPLVLFLATVLSTLRPPAATALAALAAAAWLRTDVLLVRAPRLAPLPAPEIKAYFTGFWSGEGSAPLLAFLEHHEPCAVFVHRYSRPAGYATLLAARQQRLLTVVPLTIDRPVAAGAFKAAATQARLLLGPAAPIYVLAEGPRSIEEPLLRAAGVRTTVAFDFPKGDGTTELTLLECAP